MGLIGCGRWGRLILRDLVALGTAVHVVVPTTRDASDLVHLGAASVSLDPATMPRVEGVVVATPTSMHADSIELVLPLGVPIFVEKPFTDDPDSAHSLAERAGDRVFVMDKWRYHAGVGALRDVASDGRLGRVTELVTVRTQNGHPHTDVDCSWILLPHDLSIAMEVMGAYPRPTAAVARQRDGTLYRLDIEFEFSSGATMRSTVGIDNHVSERRVSVVGSRATAILASGWDEQITVTPAVVDAARPQPFDIGPTTIAAVGELPLLAELRVFVEHLRGGPAPRSSAWEGAMAVEIIAEVRLMAGLDG